MGYFLLFEGMLDSVVYARDRWLTDSGLMAPSKMDILLAAFGDEEWYNDKVHFWNDVYGFSMNAMNSDIKNNGVVTVLPGSGMISDSLVIKVLILSHCINFHIILTIIIIVDRHQKHDCQAVGFYLYISTFS